METKSIYRSQAGKDQLMSLYDSVLARWPVSHTAFHIPTRHGDTCVIASGDCTAPPLVLLHGAASNAVSWVGDVAAYSRHFYTCALDLPGEPGKSSENRPLWIGPAFAEWLEDVLDGLNIPQAALLGLSQGGWTALKFASSFPDRVTRLVLLAPGGIAPTRSSFIAKAVFLSMFGRPGAHRINRIVYGRQPIHPEALEFMDAIMTHFRARVEKEYLFSDAELQCLDMPVLLVAGAQDAIIPVRRVIRRMELLVPNLQTLLIPDKGHALVTLSSQIIPFLLAAD